MLTPLWNGGGELPAFAKIMRDLTEQKRHEEFRAEVTKKRQEELVQANKNKDEFLAMLGHELRNPLTPLLSVVEILRRGGGDETVRQHVCHMIERQVRHMTRLVDDLLEVARISQGKVELKIEAVELTAIVLRAVETARNLIDNRRHHFSLSLPKEPIWLKGDPTRLEQVLINLLTNAAKYTDEGGKIWLAVERKDVEAVIRVQDTGIGIEPDMLPRIFDLFTQADHALDRSQGGLGVGLTLVKTLVEGHGGKVEAASAGRGQGSAFTVRLPVFDIAPTPQDTAPRPGQAAVPSLRVLVVDDNNDTADSMRMLLQLLGHQVIVAHTGPTAFHEAQKWRPHMVLLDIGLPGIDGYEVARRLRGWPETAKTFLIAMTGYGHETDRQRSKAAGIDVHLVKPIDHDMLERLLVEIQAAPH